MKHKYLWIFAALLLWCGCNEPEPVVPTPPPAKEATYVTLATTSIPTFTAQGGEAGVTFETDGAWTAKAGAAWCSVSPAQGKAGTVTLKVVVKANTSYEERTTNIVVKAGKVTKSVQVKQEAQEKPESYLKVLPDSFDVAWTGEVIRIDVDANVDYTVVMPQVEWMYEETSLNDGTGHHYILVTPNESYEPRSAEIVVRNEDKELADTVYVAQEAQEKPESYLRVQNKHLDVAWNGEIVRLDIDANVDYTVVAPDVEWLYEAPEYGGGVGTGYHYFMVTPNEGYEPRKAEIVVKNEAEGLADTVYVTQAAREKPEAYLTISIGQYRAPKEGDSMLVDVYTNTEYNLEMPEVDWLTESIHSSPEQRLFVIAPNKGYDERSAEVVFANEQYGLRSTLIVTQEAKDLLELISADKIELEASARSFELKIRTNGEPQVTSNVDWLSLKSQSQGDNYERTYVFDVDAEQAGDQRYAMIQICHKSMYLYVQVELKSVEGNGGIDDMPEHPL